MPQDDAALGTRRGDELPEELRRRQDRLAVIEAAMKRLEAEAKADGGRRTAASRRSRGRAATDRDEASWSGARSDRGDPRGEGPDQLHRPRVVDHEDGQQGVGVLRQRAGERRWGVPDHPGV